MRTKILYFALGALLLAFGVPAEAQQQAKIPRIGFLSVQVSPTPTTSNPLADAFRQGLRDLGYIEGKNILVEYRYAEGKDDLILSHVAELVQIKVDVILITSLPQIRAAKQATKTIPIVMVTTVDPVAIPHPAYHPYLFSIALQSSPRRCGDRESCGAGVSPRVQPGEQSSPPDRRWSIASNRPGVSSQRRRAVTADAAS